jgi:hypothetical protein
MLGSLHIFPADVNSIGSDMAKPTIFNVSAIWDDEASVWSGHCDEIPAAADSATLDGLLAKISRMALDLAPDNHPGIEPGSIYIQINALREAMPVAA